MAVADPDECIAPAASEVEALAAPVIVPPAAVAVAAGADGPAAMVLSEMIVSRSFECWATSLPLSRRLVDVTEVADVPSSDKLSFPTPAAAPPAVVAGCGMPTASGDLRKDEKTSELGLDGVARR